jgi:predicted RND superfamily exporter protein|tara:strand:- start:38920 stop:41391 length:2472 start_codon:yes stop_codon:yes gene_type:complete
MLARITALYIELVFRRPLLVIALVLITAAGFGYYTQYFRLDASADSLMLEGDKDLEYSREINAIYGISESVIIAYTPLNAPLFSRATLERMESLRQELLKIDRVSGVDSILNVPIFLDTPLTGISEDYLTLNDAEIDLEVAREELVNSPVFRNAVVSPDGETAGMLVSFEIDQRGRGLVDQRTELRSKEAGGAITAKESQVLADIEAEYARYTITTSERQTAAIAQIRSILINYRSDAQIFLGGAPMIADDLVTFVRDDLSSFSFGVLGFIIVALGLIFRKVRWVVLPLVCCAVAGTIMVGVLGLMDWRVTVVSSNFISLLLIITISLTVHLTVRYRELRATRHFSSHDKLLQHAVLSMFKPCLYTGLTTAVAFGSLIVSGISPIISFGWMMVMGVLAALTVVFFLFPAILTLLPVDQTKLSSDMRLNLTSTLATVTDKLKDKVLYLYAVVLLLSVIGLARLQVENSFIDYFREKTEIFQGMSLLDEKLGGTLSFDVVVDLPEEAGSFEDGFDDGFDDGFGGASDSDAYWFTAPKMDQVKAIHEYLENDPQTGKVLSFGAVIQLAEKLNGYDPIDGLLWAVLYSRIPDALKDTVLTPFVSIKENQLRFNVRVIESDPDLKRNELLQRVEKGIEQEFGFTDEQVNVTGILVLYNNVLQSLYESQILTLGVVMLAIMLMFLLLFRSLKIAIICIIPNAIAAAFVLGIMGWLGIPLDIMTITIAAISVGIGVDNTIHYMHRFKREFPRFGNYRDTMFFCHNSIGRAMYFTSMTIVAGFSILALSNFIPTIVFGLLTSLAMLVALVGSLTLLPQLLITFKPLGEEHV